MVSHLQITDVNYFVAMDILVRRYENWRVLIDRFVDIILSLPFIHARSDIRALFLIPLISIQSALLNLDMPMKDSDYVFLSIVVRKLKRELRTLFERKSGSKDQKIYCGVVDCRGLCQQHSTWVFSKDQWVANPTSGTDSHKIGGDRIAMGSLWRTYLASLVFTELIPLGCPEGVPDELVY